MMNFFGWNGGAVSSQSCPSSSSTSNRNLLEVPHTELAKKLFNLCKELDLLQPLRGLTGSLRDLCQALQVSTVPPAVMQGARVAMEFLKPFTQSDRLLECLLASYSDIATSNHFKETIAEALAAIHKSLQWRDAADSFLAFCKEVYELHLYLIFLDIKGDRALIEQLAWRLCNILGMTARSLVGSFLHTRTWVERALTTLAAREEEELLQRRHTEALQRWRIAWQERLKQLPERQRAVEEAKHGSKFWDSNFTHLFKIAWPDFVEAFENFYLLGRCPVDVVKQIQIRVDPSCSQQVSRHSWQCLIQSGARIGDILDVLLEEVYKQMPSQIYRATPLGFPALGQPFPVQEHLILSGQDDCSLPDPSMPRTPDSPRSVKAKLPKPTPWFPFAHNAADDGDMMIPTPLDNRLHSGIQPSNSAASQVVAWDDFVDGLLAKHEPRWAALNGTEQTSKVFEQLRASALKSVNSNIACTNRAMVFRVVNGDLAQNKPIVTLPNATENGYSKDDDAVDFSALPALIVTANGTRFSGITKFGRSSTRRTLIPDFPMSEPIASRSHFNVVYNQETDRYSLMDAGSKWGTFIKISSSVVLNCGDWIRVGGVEFIIRYCGGGCDSSRHHSHYKLHSLRLLQDHKDRNSFRASETRRARGFFPCIFSSSPSNTETVSSAAATHSKDFKGINCNDQSNSDHAAEENDDGFMTRSVEPDRGTYRSEGDSSSDEEEKEHKLQDELLHLLSSRRPRGWTTACSRLCQRNAHLSSIKEEVSPRQEVQSVAPSSFDAYSRNTEGHVGPPTSLPVAPLELDFISGPRMGEKLVLCDRVCTLGRGEGNSIQVSDPQLASVSRVHCIFEFIGNRWHMRDNGSTNGTWRRLSCVLQPSNPVPLDGQVSIQAGMHEFFVEEATLKRPLIPSTAIAALEEMCEQEDRRQAKVTGN